MKCWDDDRRRKEEERLLYDHFADDKSALIFRIAGKAILLAIVIFIAWSMITKASAHSWYSPGCCNDTDCRPVSGERNGIPWSEIDDMGDHYIWRSSRSGLSHRFDKGSPKIKPSRDGYYHACELEKSKIPMCLYVPTLF